MENRIESNRQEPTSSAESKRPNESHETWIIEQLTLLAEGLNANPRPSPIGIAMMAKALVDIDREKLATAFMRAIRESNFFPRPAEIRELALGKSADRELVEAEAAWNWIIEIMRRFWYVDFGFSEDAPKIPERISYALRQVGGMSILAQMENTSEPFIKRDFIAAYQRQPIAEQHSAAIAAMLPPAATQQVKRLVGDKSIERPKIEEINEGRRRVAESYLASVQRKQDEAATRLEAGRKRHAEQVEWLRERGEL